MIQTNPLLNWRCLAERFHCITMMVWQKKLPNNFEPYDLYKLKEKGAATRSELAVLQFLLHVWNHQEYEFELSGMVSWDDDHRAAFADWVNGKTLGSPSRYF